MAVAICQSCQVTLEMYSDLKMTVNLKSLTETGKSGAYRSSTFMGAVTVVNNITAYVVRTLRLLRVCRDRRQKPFTVMVVEPMM